MKQYLLIKADFDVQTGIDCEVLGTYDSFIEADYAMDRISQDECMYYANEKDVEIEDMVNPRNTDTQCFLGDWPSHNSVATYKIIEYNI